MHEGGVHEGGVHEGVCTRGAGHVLKKSRVPTPTPPLIPGLIDAHCHLDYSPMADDVPAALATARRAGVVQVVHVGCSRGSHAAALSLARDHDDVFAAVGIHPHEASTTDDEVLVDLERMAAEPSVVAIGETGLDYFYDRSPRDVQQASMRAHLELARRLDMPTVLHIRDAHPDALALVREAPGRAEAPGMVHCFTAGPDEARAWLDLGWHISFSGIATFPKSEAIREAAALCPADRILLETDAPYLSPAPARGRKNHPAHVAFTCARLADVRGEAPEVLARQAAANTRALLGMPEPASPPAGQKA